MNVSFNGEIVAFPDSMSEEEINAALLSMSEPEAEAEPDISKTESALMGVRQGGSLGFADELEGKVGQFLDWAGGSDDGAYDFGDDVRDAEKSNYEGLRDAARAEEKAAKEANPWSYGLGEVAGSMLVPGGGGGGLVKTVAKGTAEGAAYGAGASEAEDLEGVLKDAALGGSIGGVASGGLKAGTEALGSAVAKRRIAKALDSIDPVTGEKVFTSINLAAGEGEEVLGEIYKKGLGMLPGSRQQLLKQQRPHTKAAKEAVEETVAKHADARAALPKAKEAVDAQVNRQVDDAVARLADDVEVGDVVMRAEQAKKALPTYAPEELVAEIAAEADPRKVAKKLDEFWGSKGPAFQSVKGKKFTVDEDMAKMLRKILPDDQVDDVMGKKVSGKWLMELRNQPAVVANRGQGFGSAGHFAQKEKELIDGGIRRALADMGDEGGEAIVKFNDDLAQYGDYQAYVKAVDSAKLLDGKFQGTHLAGAGPKRQRRYGEAPGQVLGEAQKAARKAATAEGKVLKKAAAGTKKRLKQELPEVAAVAETKAAEKAAKKEGERMTQKAVREGASAVSQLASVGALAFIPGPVLPLLVAAALASTKTGQRAVAGQTALQAAMRKLGANEKAQLIARLVNQGMSRTAAMEFVGE